MPCGNLIAAASQCAVDSGLVKAGSPTTLVRIRDLNSGALVDSTFQSPGAIVNYSGDTVLSGVDPAAPADISYRMFTGLRTGKLLPAGEVATDVEGVRVTFVDAAVPLIIMPAKHFGVTPAVRVRELAHNRTLIGRLLRVRGWATCPEQSCLR